MTQTVFNPANTSNDQLSDFQEKRNLLVSLIQRQQGVLRMLNMAAWQEKLAQLEQRAIADNFKVLVMGEFKRGKSTFINALLGEEVLPSYATPTTAIINEVKWGEHPRAVLHWLPDANGVVREPQEIPVNQIEQYVTIKDEQMSYNPQAVVYANPYEKIELFWPLELCRNGVEIIDSPGLNEDAERQKITLDYLSTIDAAVFVIACDFPVATSEQEAIDTVKQADHETIFFVCNRFNMIAKAEDRERVKKRCISLLAPLTKQGEKHVFFIDALGALEGRLHQNEAQVEQSNLPALEEELRTFLVQERGRVKLMRPAAGLKSAIREARTAIPQQQQMLQMDIETLQTRYAQAKQGLDALEQERRDIIGYVQTTRMRLKSEASGAAIRFYNDTAFRIDSWLSTYNVKKPMGLHEVFSGKARERVVTEVAEFLVEQVGTEFKEWQRTILEPMVARYMSEMERELGEKTEHFAVGLDEVRAGLMANTSFAISVSDAQAERISARERWGAAAVGSVAGLILGDPGLAIMGGMFGFKEMLKNILPQLAVMVATTVILGPAFVIPAVLGASLVRGVFKANAINKKIRDAVGQTYKQMLQENHLDMVNKLTSNIDERLVQAQDNLDQTLRLGIQNVHEQVQSVIEEKRQGQARVNQALRELSQAGEELNQIDHQLDELIEQIALA